jgi:hypothetical protein
MPSNPQQRIGTSLSGSQADAGANLTILRVLRPAETLSPLREESQTATANSDVDR